MPNSQYPSPQKVFLQKGIVATQWKHHGDHPKVGKPIPCFNIAKCTKCGIKKGEHGVLYAESEYKVCPGDWIVSYPSGKSFVSHTNDLFPIEPPMIPQPQAVPAPDVNPVEMLNEAREELIKVTGIGDLSRAHLGVEEDDPDFAEVDEGAAQATPNAAPAGPISQDMPPAVTVIDAIRQRDHWCRIASQHFHNERFYRSLVVKIGEMFGDAAKTSDDGSVQQDVLALKVPDLVRMELDLQAANHAEIERLNRELMRTESENVTLRRRLDKREDDLKEIQQRANDIEARIQDIETRQMGSEVKGFGPLSEPSLEWIGAGQAEPLKNATERALDKLLDVAEPVSQRWAAMIELRRVRRVLERIEQRLKN